MYRASAVALIWRHPLADHLDAGRFGERVLDRGHRPAVHHGRERLHPRVLLVGEDRHEGNVDFEGARHLIHQILEQLWACRWRGRQREPAQRAHLFGQCAACRFFGHGSSLGALGERVR